MKYYYALLLCVFGISFNCYAQKPVILRQLFTRPQIHIKFNGYIISFAIRDIDRTMELISGNIDTSYPSSSHLDTSKNYILELFEGTKVQYNFELQDLMQNAIAGFLLINGKVEVVNAKSKKLTQILVDIGGDELGEATTTVYAYDPKNKKLLFAGKIPINLIHLDMGIDYY